MEQPRKRLRGAGLLTVAVAVALLAAGVATRQWRSAWLGDAWQQQLAESSDAEAPRLLRRIASTGDEAIPLLATALAADRPAVSAAAGQVLREQIRRWDTLGVSRSSPKVGILANALVQRHERYSPAAQRTAAQLATILLRWPIDPSLVEREKLVADCEAVIRSAALDNERTDRVGSIAQGAQRRSFLSGGPVGQQSHTGGVLLPFGDPLNAAQRLPGGGLPIDGLNDDSSWIPMDAPVPDEAASTHPTAGDVSRAPDRVMADLARPLGAYQARHPAAGPAQPIAAAPTRPTQPPENQPPLAANPLRAQPATPPELFAQLRSPDAAAAGSARMQLNKQGFREEQIQLAWQLTDPDPRVRQEWLTRLPSLPGIDSTPWLFWLAEDADAGVRLSAITMLATSGDPITRRRIQDLAADDDDPRIRRVAERLGQVDADGRR